MCPVLWQSRLHAELLLIGLGAIVGAAVLLLGHLRRHGGFSLVASSGELAAPFDAHPIPKLYYSLVVNHMALRFAITVLLVGIPILSTIDTGWREQSGFTAFDSLVAISALIILHPRHQRFFDFRWNLIPISLFWPAFTGVIPVVTWLTFFAW